MGLFQFLEGSEPLGFQVPSRQGACGFIEQQLRQFGYARLGKPERGLVRRYTLEDVRLLAELDALHGTLSGPATSTTSDTPRAIRACAVMSTRPTRQGQNRRAPQPPPRRPPRLLRVIGTEHDVAAGSEHAAALVEKILFRCGGLTPRQAMDQHGVHAFIAKRSRKSGQRRSALYL